MKCFLAITVLFGATMALPSAPKECDTYIEELDLTCPTDQDGVALTYADPNRCNEYWECYNGCANHMLCANDLLYDEITTWCNTAQYVDCGDRECDDDECISNVPTEAPLNFDCPSSNGYFPDETDCAKFIVCENDVATQKICPVGDDGVQWLYKAESEWCDYPENVDCEERPICDDDGNCVTDEPDQCLAAGINCSDGDGYHEEEPCGKCACYCSGGDLVGDPVCCEGDLVWNPALNVCDWDYNVPACS